MGKNYFMLFAGRMAINKILLPLINFVKNAVKMRNRDDRNSYCGRANDGPVKWLQWENRRDARHDTYRFSQRNWCSRSSAKSKR